jgi:hypothetical protein
MHLMYKNDHKIESMRYWFRFTLFMFTVSCYYLCPMTLSTSWKAAHVLMFCVGLRGAGRSSSPSFCWLQSYRNKRRLRKGETHDNESNWGEKYMKKGNLSVCPSMALNISKSLWLYDLSYFTSAEIMSVVHK